MAAMNPDLKYNVDGTLDMRCRKNKLWLAKNNERQIKTLQEEVNDLRHKKSNLESRISHQNATISKLSGGKEKELDPEDCDCSICMEPMQGRVTLKCGHELCPDCFAQQARQNNTCPFCRAEFACLPKKPRDTMPDSVADALVDRWSTIITSDHSDYFERQCEYNESRTSAQEKETHLRWLVVENAKLIIKTQVRPWYENANA